EKYPLPPDETDRLNYPRLLPAADPSLFRRLHNVAWEQEQTITPCFRLCKHHADFRALDAPAGFHLVFFDAFNPDVQPHLWTPDVLERFYRALLPGGLLVTYCVKGIVKQALRQVGFTLSRLPGPPGKREMLRAAKPPLIVP
ncbi:MAG: MnmC family methyltransferase, partial [Odoribacter sp.]